MLRWFIDGARLVQLARDNGISTTTAYRYLHEGLTVLADHARTWPPPWSARRPPDTPTSTWRAPSSVPTASLPPAPTKQTSGGRENTGTMVATSRSSPPRTAGRSGSPRSALAATPRQEATGTRTRPQAEDVQQGDPRHPRRRRTRQCPVQGHLQGPAQSQPRPRQHHPNRTSHPCPAIGGARPHHLNEDHEPSRDVTHEGSIAGRRTVPGARSSGSGRHRSAIAAGPASWLCPLRPALGRFRTISRTPGRRCHCR